MYKYSSCISFSINRFSSFSSTSFLHFPYSSHKRLGIGGCFTLVWRSAGVERLSIICINGFSLTQLLEVLHSSWQFCLFHSLPCCFKFVFLLCNFFSKRWILLAMLLIMESLQCIGHLGILSGRSIACNSSGDKAQISGTPCIFRHHRHHAGYHYGH